MAGNSLAGWLGSSALSRRGEGSSRALLVWWPGGAAAAAVCSSYAAGLPFLLAGSAAPNILRCRFSQVTSRCITLNLLCTCGVIHKKFMHSIQVKKAGTRRFLLAFLVWNSIQLISPTRPLLKRITIVVRRHIFKKERKSSRRQGRHCRCLCLAPTDW